MWLCVAYYSSKSWYIGVLLTRLANSSQMVMINLYSALLSLSSTACVCVYIYTYIFVYFATEHFEYVYMICCVQSVRIVVSVFVHRFP